jgi:hypothetical protein
MVIFTIKNFSQKMQQNHLCPTKTTISEKRIPILFMRKFPGIKQPVLKKRIAKLFTLKALGTKQPVSEKRIPQASAAGILQSSSAQSKALKKKVVPNFMLTTASKYRH